MKWRWRKIKECHYHYLEGMMYQGLSFGHYLASSQSHISWIEDIMCGCTDIDIDAFGFINPSLANCIFPTLDADLFLVV